MVFFFKFWGREILNVEYRGNIKGKRRHSTFNWAVLWKE